MPSLLALAIPAPEPQEIPPNPSDHVIFVDPGFKVYQFWRICWGIAIIIELLQLCLIQLFFNFESPQTLKETGNQDALSTTMSKIYKSEAVQVRIHQIDVAVDPGQNDGPSMLESFTDPIYRNATWVGVLMMVFAQLSGINALIFYSFDIFTSVGIPGSLGAAITNGANLVGAVGGGLMLTRFGRKTLIVFWSFVMAFFMIAMGLAYNKTETCPDTNNC